tara:strand:+ start:5866 stop:6660 length:795 start_codon:yes stop_codon:yes gene_type:complete
MNCLELFSGTGSVGKICEELGYDVVSVDMDREEATHTCNVLEFDYKQYPSNHFGYIHASPPCAVWSKCKDCWIGRTCKSNITGEKRVFTLEEQQLEINTLGKPVVDRTLEIIAYFTEGNPQLKYTIENPGGSKMKDYIKLPSVVLDYCKYSDYGYKKRTRIWTNIKSFKGKCCKRDCNCIVIIEGKMQHKKVLGNGYVINAEGKKVLCNTKELRILHRSNCGNSEKLSAVKKATNVSNGTSLYDRYRIPPELIREWMTALICEQ